MKIIRFSYAAVRFIKKKRDSFFLKKREKCYYSSILKTNIPPIALGIG
jgi:hypothetical protein